MPGPTSGVPLRVLEAAAVPPAGEWDTHCRGCGVPDHPGLFLCSHAHSVCSSALLRQAESPCHGPVCSAQAGGVWVPSSLHETCSDVYLQGLPGEGILVHLPVHTHRCAQAQIDECTRCISLSGAVLGSIHGCPSTSPSLDMWPSQPVHPWLHPGCIPSCVPVLAVDLHRWLRAMAPAGCKYWQCGGEVERFMAPGQARES